MYLPESFSIGLATESIENAENHFKNQDYLDCAREIAKAENHLLHRDNPSQGQRGINTIRACGLSEADFYMFESYLPPITALGDGYSIPMSNSQSADQIDEERAEFLLRFGKELLLGVQKQRG